MDPCQGAEGACFPPWASAAASRSLKSSAALDRSPHQAPGTPQCTQPPEPAPHPTAALHHRTPAPAGSCLQTQAPAGPHCSGGCVAVATLEGGRQRVSKCKGKFSIAVGGVSTAAGRSSASSWRAGGCRLSHMLVLKGTGRGHCLGRR